jgi:hypothetical protein
MEILGIKIGRSKKTTLYGNQEHASAQAQTEGIPIKDAEHDYTLNADPKAGHAGYYPPIKGLSPEENQVRPSDIVSKQLKNRENMGNFLGGGRKK